MTPVRGARRRAQVPNDLGLIEEGRKAPKKQMGITLWGAWGRDAPCPLRPDVFTPAGWPAVSTPVLRALAGKPGAAKYALAELDGADTAVPEGGARPGPAGGRASRRPARERRAGWAGALPACQGSVTGRRCARHAAGRRAAHGERHARARRAAGMPLCLMSGWGPALTLTLSQRCRWR